MKLFTKKTEQKESEKMFYQNEPTLLVDLKNYREFARSIEREEKLDALAEDLLFGLLLCALLILLFFALPVIF
jgi:hypothetical protein